MRNSLRGLQQRLTQSRAVLMVGFAIALAIAVPAIQYYFAQIDRIKSATREYDWTIYVRPLIPLMQLIEDHEQNAFLARNGDHDAATEVIKLKSQIDHRIALFNPIDKRFSHALDANFRWKIFSHEWINLTKEQSVLTAAELQQRYTMLLTNLWTLVVHTADSAQLSSEGHPASIYQIDVLRMQIPSLMARLAILRNLIFSFHNHPHPSQNDIHQSRDVLSLLDSNVLAIRSDLVHSLSVEPTQQSRFTKPMDQLVLDIRYLHQLNSKQLINGLSALRETSLLKQAAKAASDARWVYSGCVQNLSDALRQQVRTLRSNFYISLAATISLAAGVLILFLWLYRSMKSAIAERRGAEENLHRVNNLYAALSQTNQVIAHRCDPDTLFAEVCQIAVNHGGFTLALIAGKDSSDGRIPIHASHGKLIEYLRDFVGHGDTRGSASSNPITRALSVDEPVVINHLTSIPDADLAASFGALGLNSAAAFPLRRNGKITGVLAVYAMLSDFFDSQVTDLLIEISHGISFALDDIEREKHRRAAEQALRESELRYHLIMEGAGDAIILMDDEGRIIDLNRRAAEQFGYTRPEMLDLPGIRLFPPDDQLECQERHKAILKDGRSVNVTISAVRKDATTFPIELTESRVVFQGRPLLLGIFRDVSERKLAEDRIKYLAYHDPLTDLPNRMLLNDRLEQTLRHARRYEQLVGIIFLDLDNFKTVNDTLGHDFGDDLLKRAAARIRSSLRDVDTVARLGGDEFVVLLPEPQAETDVNRVAEKILQAMSVPFVISGQTFHITCSMGMSMFPRDGTDGSELLRNADEALYRAKKDGRNCLAIHSPEMHAAAVESLWMENDLREALTRNEFCLHYQPQVDLASGRIIGAEALVRWQHPQRGLISPTKFIPIAEEKGLMPVLGGWILSAACRQLRLWRDAGLPIVPVAVNLSAFQCRDAGLPGIVRSVLDETGIDPSLLELEITEGTLMAQTDTLRSRMLEIKKTGIRFSLDDFGIGYSSLSYLTRFPIDTLKIDISFVRGMMDDPKDLAVVDTIIDLADNLQLRTIAEGVEKSEQLMLLKLLGCHAMQGFFFSQPLAADAFALILNSDKRLPLIHPSAASMLHNVSGK